MDPSTAGSPHQQPNKESQQHPSQQSCQATTAPPASSGKNTKNLSIKEFFTTRLMRTKSFEGGGQHSPKDETTSWFDEFKARMTKKSQANASKSSKEANDDVSDPECLEMGDVAARAINSTTKSGKHSTREGDNQSDSIVKDACDNQQKSLGKLSESDDLNGDRQEDSYDIVELECEDDDGGAKTGSVENSVITSGLRTKRNNKVSSARCPDFDTASINTIFNRRDSRYDVIKRRVQLRSSLKLVAALRWLWMQVLPVNYNLPWKLLAVIQLSFLAIVLAVFSKSVPGFVAFNFLNGFICGIIVAAVCTLMLVLSLIVQFLPSSTDTQMTLDESNNEHIRSPIVKTPNVSFIEKEDKRTVVTSGKEMFTLGNFKNGSDEENEPEGNEADSKFGLNLDDNDYKGWMIEFVGDYEMRHKSDFKLKLLYVVIEDRIFQLCKPKNSNDAESSTFPVIVSKRTYNLNTAKKFSATLVLPKSVRNRQKYVWSKKYPIKLEFQDQTENQTSEGASPKMIQLSLFAKSCREKEEWFRRFKRIVEENRITQAQATKRASLRSADSDDMFISIDSRVDRSMSPSPSFKRDGVQPSQSSHVLSESRGIADSNGDDKCDYGTGEESATTMTRTRSCELLNRGDFTRGHISEQEEQIDAYKETNQLHDLQDDSTLTRETAELFSQAIEYSNFIESQPSLNYKEYIERVIESGQEATSTSDWFNALTGRIFFDVFSHNYWSLWFKKKIQRKLYRIRLPYFMETLTLTQIDLGTNAPQFMNVVSHNFSSLGLSIDFDMAYSGGLTMTFATKLNLLKIKADNSTTSSNSATTATNSSGPNANSAKDTATSSTSNQTIGSSLLATEPVIHTKDSASPVDLHQSTSSEFNISSKEDSMKPTPSSSSVSTRVSGDSSDSDESDSDSSSESFDEADPDEISDWEDYGAEKTRQSIVKFVDKIASSRYFQSATENKYIKKKLQDISNCPLVLVVKIVSLNGVLTVNVPPPQTDRIWYGFKPNPELTLKALPKMGDREVNLSPVTDWIERKLAEEFRKILVIPNMEDVVLPVLKSDHLLYVTSSK